MRKIFWPWVRRSSLNQRAEFLLVHVVGRDDADGGYVLVVVMIVVFVLFVFVVMLIMIVVVFLLGGLEEIGLEFQRAFQVEAADAEHLVERDIGIARAEDFRGGVHLLDACLDLPEVLFGNEVGLVEQDDVGEADLLAHFARVVEVEDDMLRIDDSDDAVEDEGFFHLGVGEEGLRDGAGIGQAGGLDQHEVELVAALAQLGEDADEVAAHAAADAAVVELEDLLVGLDDELVVDADLAEFVLDHGDALAVVLGEDAVEQRGLARAEEAGDDGDGEVGWTWGTGVGWGGEATVGWGNCRRRRTAPW